MDIVFDLADRITVLDSSAVLFKGAPDAGRDSESVRALSGRSAVSALRNSTERFGYIRRLTTPSNPVGYPLADSAFCRAQMRSMAMSKGRDRTISRRDDGTWENKRNDTDRASSVHDTQKDAIDTARGMLERSGGGELTTKGRDGQIRSKDTIPPGNDPLPPRDTEH